MMDEPEPGLPYEELSGIAVSVEESIEPCYVDDNAWDQNANTRTDERRILRSLSTQQYSVEILTLLKGGKVVSSSPGASDAQKPK